MMKRRRIKVPLTPNAARSSCFFFRCRELATENDQIFHTYYNELLPNQLTGLSYLTRFLLNKSLYLKEISHLTGNNLLSFLKRISLSTHLYNKEKHTFLSVCPSVRQHFTFSDNFRKVLLFPKK